MRIPPKAGFLFLGEYSIMTSKIKNRRKPPKNIEIIEDESYFKFKDPSWKELFFAFLRKLFL
jgi:hypothetical protein